MRVKEKTTSFYLSNYSIGGGWGWRIAIIVVGVQFQAPSYL